MPISPVAGTIRAWSRTRMACAVLGLFVWAACGPQPKAIAQCPGTWTTDGAPGITGTARGTTTWDADGPGPQPPVLVVVGALTTAGGSPCKGAATFDGHQWQALPNLPASPDPADISAYSVIEYHGTLYVGGRSSPASFTSKLVRLNGAAWELVPGAPAATSANILSMTVFEDRLVVAASAGNGSRMSAYDGTTWQDLGPVFTSGAATMVGVWNGQLLLSRNSFAGGALMRWNGAAWENFPGFELPGSPVYTFATDGADLVIGGAFTSIGPAGGAGPTAASFIARYDGQLWYALGSGLPKSATSILRHAGALYAFASNAGSNGEVRVLNGGTWSAVLPGLVGAAVLATHAGDLYVAGGFSEPSTAERVFKNIARFDGTEWRGCGGGEPFVGTIERFGVHDGKLFAAFYSTPSATVLSPQETRLAWRDGDRWRPFDPQLRAVRIRAIQSVNGELLLGGSFTAPPEVAGRGIIRWTGTAWEPLGGGATYVGGTSSVRDIVQYRGELVIGGDFTAAGGVSATGIAAWNGASWRPLGTGLGPLGGDAASLAVVGNWLLAAGSFTTADGLPAPLAAQWNGQRWFPGPLLPSGIVRRTLQPVSLREAVILNYADTTGAVGLLVGGQDKPSMWNGVQIGNLGPFDLTAVARTPPLTGNASYSFNGSPNATCVHDGAMYWGGQNTRDTQFVTKSNFPILQRADLQSGTFAQVPASFGKVTLVRSAFSSLSSSGVGVVLALLSDGDTIHVAGEFASVNGMPAWGYAQLHQPRRPFIITDTVGRGTLPGGSIALSVVADGTPPLTYQWLRDGQPIADGAGTSGAVYSGVDTPDLGIVGVQPGDQGQFVCRITNSCGTVDSAAASVSTCPADYDRDGQSNPDDIGDFVTDYFTDPAVPGPGGFAVACIENAPPFDSGYRAAFTPDLAGQCSPPGPDNLGDFITSYFGGC